MRVAKRDGRQESVHFDNITARLKKLSYVNIKANKNSNYERDHNGYCNIKEKLHRPPEGPELWSMGNRS